MLLIFKLAITCYTLLTIRSQLLASCSMLPAIFDIRSSDSCLVVAKAQPGLVSFIQNRIYSLLQFPSYLSSKMRFTMELVTCKKTTSLLRNKSPLFQCSQISGSWLWQTSGRNLPHKLESEPCIPSVQCCFSALQPYQINYFPISKSTSN